MDRYIFIDNEFITIYNETENCIERIDFYINSFRVKKDIIHTNERLKTLFTNDLFIVDRLYKKIKTTNTTNYIYTKKDIIVDKYIRIDNIFHSYILEINDNIDLINLSKFTEKSDNIILRQQLNTTNIIDLKVHNRNEYLKLNKNLIIFF